MMTLAWKQTLAEWARFSKAVIGRDEERARKPVQREQASLVTMLPCSPYFSDVCKGQQGMKEIRFGANRSRCFLKHSNIRRDSDCQRYWVYLRTNAYLSLREVSVNILDAGLNACEWGKYNGIILGATQLVRKHLTSASSSIHFSFYLSVIFSLPLSVVLGPVLTSGSIELIHRRYQVIHKSKHRYIHIRITSSHDAITYSMKVIASLETLFVYDHIL